VRRQRGKGKKPAVFEGEYDYYVVPSRKKEREMMKRKKYDFYLGGTKELLPNPTPGKRGSQPPEEEPRSFLLK